MTRVLRPRSTDASRIPMEGWAARRIVVMAEERAKPELWTDCWRNRTSSGTPWQAAWDYWVDAAQRTVLFCDVMRKRGNMFLEHEAKGKPPVLAFEHEMVLDGRTLGRPVNYFLVRIIPPTTVPGSAAPRWTTRSAWPCVPTTRTTSSASERNPCPNKRSKISAGP